MSSRPDLMEWLEQEFGGLDGYGVYYLVGLTMSRLEAEMNRRGMTKTELAKRAGLNRAYLSRIFADPPNVTMGTLVAIANALDLRLDILVVPRDAPPSEDRLAECAPAEASAAAVLGS